MKYWVIIFSLFSSVIFNNIFFLSTTTLADELNISENESDDEDITDGDETPTNPDPTEPTDQPEDDPEASDSSESDADDGHSVGGGSNASGSTSSTDGGDITPPDLNHGFVQLGTTIPNVISSLITSKLPTLASVKTPQSTTKSTPAPSKLSLLSPQQSIDISEASASEDAATNSAIVPAEVSGIQSQIKVAPSANNLLHGLVWVVIAMTAGITLSTAICAFVMSKTIKKTSQDALPVLVDHVKSSWNVIYKEFFRWSDLIASQPVLMRIQERSGTCISNI